MKQYLEKQVVFVGGVQGAGKSSLCEKLKYEYSCIVVKQRHALIKIGKKYGLNWEEVASLHDKFIGAAAESVAETFLNEPICKVLLVDCHYAIRSNKALRLNGLTNIAPYIQDIDTQFINRLKTDFRVKFVLMDVLPSIAIKRFAERPVELLDYDNTLEGLCKQRQAEQEKYDDIISQLKIPNQDQLRVFNNNEFEKTMKIVRRFISDSSSEVTQDAS